MTIYYANMGKATGINEQGKRPVIVVSRSNNKASVYKITSRKRTGLYYAKIDDYLVYGNCEVSKLYTIDTKYLTGFIRSCTTGEELRIIEQRDKYLKWIKNKENIPVK